MNRPKAAPRFGRTGFRARLLVAMMVVVAAMTLLAVYVAQRKLAAETARDLQTEFQTELAALHNLQEVRHVALAERCRALARKPRIHAALEDNALDLLYLSARDELRDLMEEPGAEGVSPARSLHAEFYRFLDSSGAVIAAPSAEDVGDLTPREEARLALPSVPREQQLGYLLRDNDAAGEMVAEIIAVPIFSTETGEPIAALVLGFKPIELGGQRLGRGMRSGIWVGGEAQVASLPEPIHSFLGDAVTRALASANREQGSSSVSVEGEPQLLFYKRLNPGSLYPRAYEICVFPLTESLGRQRQLRWQILTAGVLMLALGFAASHFLSRRLAVPVEKLAADSELNRVGRKRAETALEQTSVELQRSIRFSADASHQLKTPTSVLRAGLEELLARERLTPEMRDEIAELIHQTYRLAGVIDDLLLLSRMDAGRLQLSFGPVNISQILEGELDDFSAQPNALELAIEPDFPAALHVAGEKRYTTLILRNLLENACKYNRRGGRIRVTARPEGEAVLVSISNTGGPIPCSAREHIFERFHRGAAAENVPGHGLGLNIARELARLHGGNLRLVRSDEEWTEFEVRFRAAKPTQVPAQTT